MRKTKVTKGISDTTPKPFVFVLMPFSPDFDDTYQLGIRAACDAANTYCERVDEQIFTESILQRVYNQIARADLIIADMTGRNPNVFYETGYAHALGRPVILLTQNSDDIPFDLKHYPHIIYGGKIAALKLELEKRVRWHIENALGAPDSVVKSLEFYIGGMLITSNAICDINVQDLELQMDKFEFSLDIHNPTDIKCDATDLSVAVIFPPSFKNVRGFGLSQLPDGSAMHQLKYLFDLPPQGWQSESIDVQWQDKKTLQTLAEKSTKCILRIFYPDGPEDIEFFIRYHLPKKRTSRKKTVNIKNHK